MSTSTAEDMPSNTLPGVDPADQPLASPPPGQTANLAHPASNAYHAYITAAICIFLILVFSILRIYSNVYIRDHRTLDDYPFMLASVCVLVYISLVVALLSKGLFGTHVWDLTLGDLRNTPFLLVLLLESLWGPFVWFIKLSLFLLYLHLFEPLRWIKKVVWMGIVVTGLFYFSITVAKLAMCAPRGSQTYIMAFSTARCSRAKVLGVITGAFNIVSDLYLLVIPIPAILGLQVSTARKRGLLAIFMTGFIAVIASILGIVYRIKVNSDMDDTWKIVPFYLAVLVEMTCGIVVICMPAMAQIARHRGRPNPGSVNRANGNANEQATSIPMTNLPTFAGLRTKLSRGRSRHGHRCSDDSRAQIRSNSSSGKALEEMTALPE
ncbi:MAG: hypothetical protein Q9211_004878, partial [Gyalolechia sp. 1 TL-2023]